tara:strand:- start:22 stop:528 length:507 start_codon:yes stop_codon:yes gene_type:complete
MIIQNNSKFTDDSMIKIIAGDIFDTDAEVIVNPVNCIGVMGKGLAKVIKKQYPWSFSNYEQACKRNELTPGGYVVSKFESMFSKDDDYPIIIHLATKGHWRSKSKIEDIERGLENLVDFTNSNNIESVALPQLGCGLGGLDWEDLEPIFYHHLSNSQCEFIIYIYRQE